MDKNIKDQFQKSCKKIQKSIFVNKRSKGFNITNIPLEFCLIEGELSESFDAWRKNKDDLNEEIADVAIYLFGLAAILEIDLGKEVIKKIEKNKKREYHLVKGILVKK